MSYKINKYADKKDFIVEYNHNQGLLLQDGAELVEGVYVEFTYALERNEIMYTEEVEIEVDDYNEEGEVIGTHTETRTLNYPIVDPDYEAKEAQKEAERVSKLTCTKRVFALMLQELGISYAQLKELIATSEQAQLEWDLCVELVRENPLLDIMASQLGITAEQLDGLFKYANGEITIDEFRGLIPTEQVEDTTEQVTEQEEEVIND